MNPKDEGHGTTHREALYRSMEIPAKIREAKYVPRISFWSQYGYDIMLVAQILLLLAVFVGGWMAINRVEGVFR